MAPDTLAELLKLPPSDRAELAMALWESLDDASRGAELALTPEQIAELVTARPLSFPKVHGEMRRAVLRRFPDGVFFRMSPDEIIVLAIIHGRRHPRQGRSRQ